MSVKFLCLSRENQYQKFNPLE